MPHLSHPKYRPDIDGLRAIAVLAVVAYHAFPGGLKGGFVGVDVFFVISGYLISTIIFENLERGTFRFSEFYARRIKRIFPALLLVLVACYAFGWRALLADEYRQLGKHISAGAGFVSNLVFWGEAGYFDTSAETKPLLHLWSLGVEEQFYIVWPLLVWFAWKRNFNLLTVTALVAGLSFFLNVSWVRGDAVAAFYSPQTRFWELLCGGLLAWGALYRKEAAAAFKARADAWLASLPPRTARVTNEMTLSHALSFLGSLLLAFGFWRINRRVTFPGAWAVVPVLGSTLLILAGPKAWVNRTLLSTRPAVWFGLISFPLYLWHWPLLSFARIVRSEDPGTALRTGAIGVSILLAWLTYRLVERPMRRGDHTRGKVVALVGLMSLMGYVGYDTYRRDGIPSRSAVQGFANNTNELLRTPATDPACLAFVGGEPPLFPYCRFTEAGGKETVAVVGDSHAHVAYPGIAEYLKAEGVNTVLLANSSCPPLLGVPIFGKSGVDRRACQDRIDQLIHVLLTHPEIRRVVFIARGPIYVTGTEPITGERDVMGGAGVSIAEYRSGTQRTIDTLVAAGKEVIYLTENPELMRTPEACIVRPLREHASDCRVDRSSVLARQAEYLSMVRTLSGVTVINGLDAFCPGEQCVVFDSAGALLYADDHHLSVAGSRFQMAHALARVLK
ncbi:MAG TPA: acyltransferase family protein [Gemmatimonadales bacterium]|nr:acyltransferase family protein [Gemmatimonadales bacterium]